MSQDESERKRDKDSPRGGLGERVEKNRGEMAIKMRWSITPVDRKDGHPEIRRQDRFWIEAIGFMKNLDQRNVDGHTRSD